MIRFRQFMGTFALAAVIFAGGCGQDGGFRVLDTDSEYVAENGCGRLTLTREDFGLVQTRNDIEVLTTAHGADTLAGASIVTARNGVNTVIPVDAIERVLDDSAAAGGESADDGAVAFIMKSGKELVGRLIVGPLGADGFTVRMAPDFTAFEDPVVSWGFTFDIARMGHIYGQGILTAQKNYREQHYNTGVQRFPMDRGSFERPIFTTDEGTNIVSPLWFTSRGLGIFIDSYSSLDLSFNSTALVPGGNGMFRIHVLPLEGERDLTLNLISEATTVEAYKTWVAAKWTMRPDLPVGARPEDELFTRPIWTSWAAYKWEIDRDRILGFAHDIVDHGYDMGFLEIDDKWTPAWGDLRFDPAKFPDAATMVDEIHGLGSKVTAWIPPFVNSDAADFQSGVDARAYAAGGADDDYPPLVGWWDVIFVPFAGAIDFTRDEGREWWGSKVDSLSRDYGLDGFKYDAGETCFLPKPVTLGDSVPFNAYPDHYAAWGVDHSAAEMRSGWFGQNLPVLFRLFDKNSEWGLENGIASVVTQYLTLGMIGYPFVMPDMLCGNEYLETKCDDELMVRWAEMNALMPCVQYSILPWRDGFDASTNEIVKKFHDLRATFADEFIRLADEAAATQMPMVRPLFFQFPDDAATYEIEDQFMLGDRYLVAPVLVQGAVSRDLYLPAGNWRAIDNPEETHVGPATLANYPAPLDRLPAFKLQTP